MNINNIIKLLIITYFNQCITIEGSKILVFFPALSKSHMVLARALSDGLTEKGHDVTLVSPFVQKNSAMREIEMPDLVKHLHNGLGNNTYNMHMLKQLSSFLKIFQLVHETNEIALNNTNVQNLLKSNETFDVVILDMVMNEAHIALGYHFKAPVIALSTIGPNSMVNDLVGNPNPYAYVPSIQFAYSDHMTFKERFVSTLLEISLKIAKHLFFLPNQKKLVQKYFPAVSEDIHTIMNNVSLVLLNSHISTSYPSPLVPNMVEIGGFHVKKPKPLSKELQEYLNDAPYGVIYFSMGSILKSSDLPQDKLDVLINVFGNLKQKVLWKWENETLVNQPKNLKISSWLPQQDILAHPNVKLFITHGGLLSTTEAIYHGVPLIGIPMFADQFRNIQKAELLGYAISIEFEKLTKLSLTNAINTLLNNETFTNNIKLRSKILRDRELGPLSTAIFWIEYIIRYNGATHLKSASLKLNWFQYLLLDVVITMLMISFMTVIITYFCVKILCRKIKKFIFYNRKPKRE